MILPLYDRNPHERFPLVTLLLIVINVWITWQMALLPEMRQAEVLYRRGFVPLRLTRIDDPQPVRIRQPIERPDGLQAQGPRLLLQVDLPTDSPSVYSSMFSTMFLHGGWLHLITNMWMLWVFGNNIEDRLGHLVFAMFYIICGVLASLSHWVVDPESQLPVVGASGAVAGVLGAYALTFPWAKVASVVLPIPYLFNLPAFIVLGQWVILETVAGIRNWGPADVGVAHWAHIGGFIAGLVLMPLLAIGRSPEGVDWKKETDEQFKFEEPAPLTKRQ